jgi:hypothetical protein
MAHIIITMDIEINDDADENAIDALPMYLQDTLEGNCNEAKRLGVKVHFAGWEYDTGR